MSAVRAPARSATMTYKLFLFDLDDTLLDYQKSEQLCFTHALREIGFLADASALLRQFQAINFTLWGRFEAGAISREHLQSERWRQTFLANALELDHERARSLYLASFSDHVALVDGAEQVCQAFAAIGEVGVITNGVDEVQKRRLAASGLLPHISFVSTSEACGFAKPDVRFFEHTARLARPFDKSQAIIIGDRLEADIAGAMRYGIESCWFNPRGLANASSAIPTHEVQRLGDLVELLTGR